MSASGDIMGYGKALCDGILGEHFVRVCEWVDFVLTINRGNGVSVQRALYFLKRISVCLL